MYEGAADTFSRIVLVALAIFALGLMAIACSGSSADPSLTQTQADLSATLVINPYPPSVMQDTVLELSVKGADGKPMSGADVQFDLTMPAMEMPENKPNAVEGETGTYKADALFTMSGEWQIEARVKRAGESTVFIFMINLK